MVLKAQQKPAITHMMAGIRFGEWVGLAAMSTPTNPPKHATQRPAPIFSLRMKIDRNITIIGAEK
ncbi:hypothetical protein FQZ97_972130 [compost metagenome]